MYDLHTRNIHIFLEKYGIKNEAGIKLDFREHAYLWDIYEDMSEKQVCLKAAQIGFSTAAIVKTLWVAKYRGFDIIYTLPTSQDVKDFAGGKVNRIIQQNPIFQQFVQDRDTVEQKRVGENIIYYRGTFTDRAALMVSSDLNVHDEEDRSNQPVLQQYASRQQHSKNKWEWHFSNPSVEGNGVSRYWPQSDQKHWFVKCSKCGKKQYMSWPESVCQDRQVFVCKHCNKELDEEDRRLGEWVSKYKNKEYKGYWISLLMAPWIKAKDIIKYHNEKSEEFFFNFILGLPYVGAGNQVTPDMVYRNLTHQINDQSKCVIGVDQGNVKHYVVGNDQGLFWYGKTEDWDDIERLLKRFKNSIMVIDALPDLTKPRELREKYPGRVFLCHYARDRKTMQLIRWGKDNEAGNVLADRNRVIQMVIDEFTDSRIPLQGNRDDWSEYYSHWKTLYRTMEVDALGTPVFEWHTSTGMDHFAHATVYWRIGMDWTAGGGGEIFIPHEGLNVPTGPEVLPDDTIKFNPLRR